MLALKRSGLAALSAGIALSIAGCSDYPGDGVIDTKELRKMAKIVEVEGNVYGIKTGGVDAYAVYEHDKNTLRGVEYAAWESYREGKGVPKLELQYSGSVEGFELSKFQSALDAAVEEAVTEVEAELAEDIAEAKAKRDELAAKLQEVSEGGAKFESYVADAKAEYEAAQKALNEAIDAYNAEIERPLNKLNEIAETNGLQKVRDYQNPIKNFRSIDFSDRSMPSSCPRQAGYTTVDLRKEQELCGYIRLGSRFDPYVSEVVSVTKAALIKLPDLQAAIGKKGGWNRDATGAYATLDTAEDAYKTRTSEARSKFGNDLQRKRQQNHLSRSLDRAENQLAKVEGDEHRDYLMRMGSIQLPRDVKESASAYIDTLEANVAGYIEKGPEITLGDKDAEFSGFNGDYEGAVVVADFIAGEGNRRDNMVSIHFIDLTDEAVKNADQLSAELSRESFRDGRRIDIREPESIEEGILDRLDDVVQDRRRADKA